MEDACTRDFSAFTRDRIKPVVDGVMARKRRSLFTSLAAAAGTFLLCAVGVYIFLIPYRQLMQDHNVTYWPLLIFAPLSLAMVIFCLVYILSLRGAVSQFRTALIDRMAEFIHPGLVHDAGRELSREERALAPLSLVDGEPVAGSDQFRGQIDGVAVRLHDLRCLGGSGGEGGKKNARSGLYFHASFARPFAAPVVMLPENAGTTPPVGELTCFDDAAHGRRLFAPAGDGDFARRLLSGEILDCLESLRRQRGTELFLACDGNVLRMALLTRTGRRELPGGFDGFDFGHCREFCLDAALCLAVSRDLAGRADVWA